MKYLSILGQNPELSIAELQSVYDIKIEEQTNDLLIFESSKKINLNNLGGTPKLTEIIGEYQNIKQAKQEVINNLLDFPEDKKIFFGLSFYNNEDKKTYLQTGKDIKKELKNNNRKVRWVVSQDLTLSSVVIKTNKLLTRGADYNLLFINKKIIIAKTIDVQDFFDYEFRDIKRPVRDLISGMTPPKLAKILINLAGKSDTFLDPFCGSGTFLAEAGLLGFQNIYGSDISKKAVHDSITNTEWLKEKYQLDTKFNIKECDVKNIKKCWAKTFPIIVGEAYLGPPIRGKIGLEEANKLIAQLEKNYNEYLVSLSSVLEKNGKLVLIVPFIITDKQNLHLNLDIKKYGLKSAQSTILYSRKNQKIGREIYILTK